MTLAADMTYVMCGFIMLYSSSAVIESTRPYSFHSISKSPQPWTNTSCRTFSTRCTKSYHHLRTEHNDKTMYFTWCFMRVWNTQKPVSAGPDLGRVRRGCNIAGRKVIKQFFSAHIINLWQIRAILHWIIFWKQLLHHYNL